jgi:hypothetical protein
MKKERIWKVAAVAVLLLIFSVGPASAKTTLKEGGLLPVIVLPVPENAAHRDYLGLSGEGKFEVPEIKADLVIIEIFSLYCPACQAEAGRVNELYRLIESKSKLKGRVKLIGIGAGNTPFEVNVFKEKYDTPFPLFPDADYTVHQSIGEVRTPYFIAVKIKKDGSHEIVFTQLGGFKVADEFLGSILKSADLH